MIKSEKKSITDKITFTSDGFILKGVLHLPIAIKRPPLVIGSHGLLSSSSSPKQIELAKQCNANSIAFFRFDHRGCGESTGIFQDVTSLEGRCNDLTSAIKIMQARNDIGERLGVFGSSLGGATCLSVAAEIDIDALVLFAAPVKSRLLIDSANKFKGINSQNLIPDKTLNNVFEKKKIQFDISDKLSGIKRILVFHGNADNVVLPSNAHIIYDMADEPKKLIIQKDGDHLMSNPDHQKNFISEALLWFKTWLLR